MTEDAYKVKVSQKDICRCCLSASGKWDLTSTYITEKGLKEVFADMLYQCFGITISHVTELDSNKQICELCVIHIRNANNFKKQVLKADKYFSWYWERKNDIVKESELCRPKDSNNDISVNTISDNRQKKSFNTTDISYDNDDDSDTPLISLRSKMVEEHGHINNESLQNMIKANISKEDSKNESLPRFLEKQNKKFKNTKQVSERKRISSTCSILLKETTACPFRHYKSWFQCFFCLKGFMEISLLRDHTQESHTDIDKELKQIKHYPRSLQIDISKLECRHCNLKLKDIHSMKSHFDEKHNKVIYNECIADYKINSSPYSCHICKQEFHVFRTLTTHLNEHYANCICDVCGKSFLNLKRLKVHKRTHENGMYPCTECGKVLKTKTAKANHKESAHSKRIIKCQICYKPMKHYNDRIKHMSDVHNITHKFQCFICGKEYNVKHYLATHIRQTHGHKNKRCVECDMAFITNHSLKKHMLKHSGERPFRCSVCSKSYSRSYTLKEHMRAHEMHDNL